MQTPLYIEDLIEKLYARVLNFEVRVQHQDIAPMSSFYIAISTGKLLTRKQGMFILQLLKKYKTSFVGIDINAALHDPKWKSDFRVIDTTKHLYLTVDSTGINWINIKFPYSFKEVFAKEFFTDGKDPSRWDPEQMARTVKLSNVNLVFLVEQATKHGFDIDESVYTAVAYIEELWNNEEQLLPYSIIENATVHLVNANEYAEQYWNLHKTGEIYHDLLLAKQMGFLLKGTGPSTAMTQIATTNDREFWAKNPQDFYSLVDKLNVWPVVIILDRHPDPKEWVKKFINEFNFENFTTDDIRICFRPANSEKDGPEFNEWIKSRNLNKPVVDGKIFICQIKPQKWMFEKTFRIELLASNSIYPSTNSITSAMIASHPNVFYFDEIKPSAKRNTKIVSL